MYRIFFSLMILFLVSPILAATFPLPVRGNDIVGDVKTHIVKPNETFASIAHDFDICQYELVESNPHVNPKNPLVGTVLIIPSRYILPNTPREEMVINLAELRLYYYPRDKKEVWVFPVGIGREGEQTPVGYLRIVEHRENPTWHSPEAIRKARAKEGVVIPKVVPPGPDNPLGKFAMRLSRRNYLIHGTNDNGGVGQRSSSGCIRMYPKDIKKLFHAAKNGTSVLVINEPFKIGRDSHKIFFEAHMPLHEKAVEYADVHQAVMATLSTFGSYKERDVNWDKTVSIAKEQQGLPQEIGKLKA